MKKKQSKHIQLFKLWRIKTIFMIMVFMTSCNSKTGKKSTSTPKKTHSEHITKKVLKTNQHNYKIIDIFMSDIKLPSIKKLYEYTETLIGLENGNYMVGDSTNYQLDSNGNIYKETRFDREKKIKGITTFDYDNKNRKTKMRSENFDGGDPFEMLFEYNDMGQIISTTTRSSILERTKYFYDSFNNISKEIIFDKNGSIWRQTVNFYDTDGNHILKIITNKNGDTVAFSKRIFNDANLCIESESQGEPINCAGRNKWKMEYNENGDKISVTSHDLVVKTTYEYDKFQNKLKELTFSNNDIRPNFLIRRYFKYH